MTQFYLPLSNVTFYRLPYVKKCRHPHENVVCTWEETVHDHAYVTLTCIHTTGSRVFTTAPPQQ
jgi:hypothetical protein